MCGTRKAACPPRRAPLVTPSPRPAARGRTSGRCRQSLCAEHQRQRTTVAEVAAYRQSTDSTRGVPVGDLFRHCRTGRRADRRTDGHGAREHDTSARRAAGPTGQRRLWPAVRGRSVRSAGSKVPSDRGSSSSNSLVSTRANKFSNEGRCRRCEPGPAVVQFVRIPVIALQIRILFTISPLALDACFRLGVAALVSWDRPVPRVPPFASTAPPRLTFTSSLPRRVPPCVYHLGEFLR